MTPDEAAAALTVEPGDLDATVAALPGAPGHLAWWAAPSVLPALGGAPHPRADLRLLDLGVATMLRNRVRRQDLYRAGVSRLRRVAAGLLLDELALAPTWAADVVLPTADEERLTTWLRARLVVDVGGRRRPRGPPGGGRRARGAGRAGVAGRAGGGAAVRGRGRDEGAAAGRGAVPAAVTARVG